MRRALLLLVAGCAGSPASNDAGTADAFSDASSPVRTFAFRKMFVGETDRAFKPSSTAWRSFGENLDGTSTDSCRAAMLPGEDGEGGIDNAFGAKVLPLLMQNGFAIPSLQFSQSIQQGVARPLLVRLAAPTLSVRIGKPLSVLPDFFTGDGSWVVSSLVASELSMMTDVAGAMHAGAAASASPVLLLLPWGNTVLRLRIRRFAVDASISPDGKALEHGTFAGILDPNELVEAARQAMGAAMPSVCTSFDAIAASIRAARDILADGTQNLSADCDAISLGMGFEGVAMKLGPVEDDPMPALACP